MEEKKKSVWKNIIITVLLIIIILLGGTFYYLYTNQDKMIEKCPVENTNESNEDKENLEDNFNINNKTIIQALNGELYTILISKKGEAFLKVYNDQSNEHLKEDNIEHIKKLQEQYTLNTIEGYCNTEGEYRKDACEDNDNVKAIKLDTSNVIAAYESINGQDIDSLRIIFLKSDGTIDSLNIGSLIWSGQNPKIQKKVGNLKNIVTIAQTSNVGGISGSKFSIAIESNGTQHSLIGLFDY